MARTRPINLPAPYLRRIWLDPALVPGRERYPFGLPLLMTFPGATLLAATPRGFVPTTLEATSHFQLIRDFSRDPHAFVRAALAREDDEDDA